ncbi:MAG: MAPEG family protein [Alphaproteobacteria bacterium]|nr:MAPEG family protein [Alphaproteobacteria bacterium]
MNAPLLSPELYWLTLTALMTAMMWVPYILQLIAEMGLFPALMDRFHDTGLKAGWAQRAKRAHANAVENLVVFAALVLAVHGSASGNSLTALACQIYFFARAAHYVVYVAALPLVRTLLFAVGVGCQVALAGVLLGYFH